MKKISYYIIALISFIFISCSNEDILIETTVPEITGSVVVNVPLTNLIQSYDFYDTKHDIDISDSYRTFNSENGLYILYMSLFYDKATGSLIKGIHGHSKDTNSKVIKTELPIGRYYVITTLYFTYASSGLDSEKDYWTVYNGSNIRTAKMKNNNHYNQWAVMSVSTNEMEVITDMQTSINANPQPVGALCYLYLQNFQYRDETVSSVSDNGIRNLSLYTQNLATYYNLDPNATSKYDYVADAGQNYMYYLSVNTPDMFDSNWTFFKSNMYDFCYILAPKCDICFGLTPEGAEGFSPYGNATYSIQSGKVYLAYWDWFKVGNPYFGIADNNHWNNYPASRASLKGCSFKREFSLTPFAPIARFN